MEGKSITGVALAVGENGDFDYDISAHAA